MTGELKLGDLQISRHRAVSWPLCRADGLQGEVSIENYQQVWSGSRGDGCKPTEWEWSRGCSLETKRNQSCESSSVPGDDWDQQDWEWWGGDSETGLASAPGIWGWDWARETPERKEIFLKIGAAGHLVSGRDSRGRRQKRSERMVGPRVDGDGHPLWRRSGEKELWERRRWAGGRRCSSETQGAWRFPLALWGWERRVGLKHWGSWAGDPRGASSTRHPSLEALCFD